MHPLTRNMGEQEEPLKVLFGMSSTFDVEGPAKTNYEGETIFNAFF